MIKNEKNSEIIKIDKRDLELLKILSEDGRMPILEIAKRMKLSHETVRYRLNKLIKLKVIEKFGVSIDEKKLGYNVLAVIMIATWNYVEREWNEFLEYLMKNKYVTSVAKVTGRFDLKISIMAHSTEEFDLISHEIKTKFSKVIKDWETFIFTREYKWEEIPF